MIAASVMTYAGAYSAMADTVVIDDDPDVVVTQRTEVYRAQRPDVTYETRYEAPVYGWGPARPLNCGRYHYWDGVACVDAREHPSRD